MSKDLYLPVEVGGITFKNPLRGLRTYHEMVKQLKRIEKQVGLSKYKAYHRP